MTRQVVRIPFVIHLGTASQALPLLAAAVWRPRVSGARAWVLLWCTVLVVADALGLWLGHRMSSNLLLLNLVTPTVTSLALWALSCCQGTELWRLTFRLAIVPFILFWAALTYTLDDFNAFTRVADPMASLVGLGAAAFTLVARSRSTDGPLHRRDWFWISGGMALYFGTASALAPFSALLVGEAPTLVVRAYELKSVLDVFAFLAIARGVTCPVAT